jgi:hypothetical protein
VAVSRHAGRVLFEPVLAGMRGLAGMQRSAGGLQRTNRAIGSSDPRDRTFQLRQVAVLILGIVITGAFLDDDFDGGAAVVIEEQFYRVEQRGPRCQPPPASARQPPHTEDRQAMKIQYIDSR